MENEPVYAHVLNRGGRSSQPSGCVMSGALLCGMGLGGRKSRA